MRSLRDIPKNTKLADWWSVTHIAWGFVLTLLFGPLPAFIILLLWEPFEVLLLSRLSLRYFDIVFGHEGWQNSLVDIVMNAIGIGLAYLLL